MGGYLASIKAAEKLVQIIDLAKRDEIWVGLDGMEEDGRFVWQEDASILTQAITDILFYRGQPSNYRGVQLMEEKLKLNVMTYSARSNRTPCARYRPGIKTSGAV
ncbi:hypothetical protein RRG08_009042 [Elysia crispata]|uniref:Uncharacterized protein n=1 Tax=Elysia crispata TaxID=231223 RepID=A0AAE1D1U6_9GAST|nr:hypothetical protein RRG08_009042 [Elysia crispata]